MFINQFFKPVMTLPEFNLLTFEQKCLVLGKSGIYLGGYNDGPCAYNLYSLFSFYTEACFNLDDHTLDTIQPLEGIDALDRYLEEIMLSL